MLRAQPAHQALQRPDHHVVQPLTEHRQRHVHLVQLLAVDLHPHSALAGHVARRLVAHRKRQHVRQRVLLQRQHHLRYVRRRVPLVRLAVQQLLAPLGARYDLESRVVHLPHRRRLGRRAVVSTSPFRRGRRRRRLEDQLAHPIPRLRLRLYCLRLPRCRHRTRSRASASASTCPHPLPHLSSSWPHNAHAPPLYHPLLHPHLAIALRPCSAPLLSAALICAHLRSSALGGSRRLSAGGGRRLCIPSAFPFAFFFTLLVLYHPLCPFYENGKRNKRERERGQSDVERLLKHSL